MHRTDNENETKNIYIKEREKNWNDWSLCKMTVLSTRENWTLFVIFPFFFCCCCFRLFLPCPVALTFSFGLSVNLQSIFLLLFGFLFLRSVFFSGSFQRKSMGSWRNSPFESHCCRFLFYFFPILFFFFETPHNFVIMNSNNEPLKDRSNILKCTSIRLHVPHCTVHILCAVFDIDCPFWTDRCR